MTLSLRKWILLNFQNMYIISSMALWVDYHDLRRFHFKGPRLHAFKWSPLNLKSVARHVFLLINILVLK